MFSLPTKAGAILVLGLGVCLAGYAVTQAQAYVEQIKQSQITSVPMTTVFVLAHDVARGDQIGPDDLTETEFATSSIPASLVPNPTGLWVNYPMSAGTPVTLGAVSKEQVLREPKMIRVRRGTVVTEEAVNG